MIWCQVYVNSFIALLNSRYYLQANRDSTVSSKSNVRHSVYLSERYLPSSQDERLKGEHFNHADDEATVHPARPVQAGSCVSVDETEATASACGDSRKTSYLELVWWIDGSWPTYSYLYYVLLFREHLEPNQCEQLLYVSGCRYETWISPSIQQGTSTMVVPARRDNGHGTTMQLEALTKLDSLSM